MCTYRLLTISCCWRPVRSTQIRSVCFCRSPTQAPLESGLWKKHPFHPSPGGQYRICWCSSMVMCSTATDFKVDAGNLLVIGPAPLNQQRTCLSGERCTSLHVHGQELSENDTLQVLDTCGAAMLSAGWPNSNVGISVVSPSTLLLNFQEPILAAAGTYRLCWCQPLPHDFAGASCTLHSQNLVDFGQVRLMGPALLQRRTCMAGQRCVLEDLSLGAGTTATPQDTVIVLDTCAHITPIPWLA